MAFDEGLAERLRELFEKYPAVEERKMFGGLCFLISGNMCCGISLQPKLNDLSRKKV